MSLKTLLIDPLVELQTDVYRETGTRPTFEIYVHSHLYDELLAEISLAAHRYIGPLGRDGMWIYGDINIKPERARPR